MILTGTPPDRVWLEVLGRIGLRTDRDEVRAVLVQPKRLALLVWLTLRRPGGFVRRDELLGTFWPDSTEARARASLRQALQFLRRRLGTGIVVRRGDAELGVDPDILNCDALAFLDTVARGDGEAAMECYGGDLMPGFLLEGAHEFDRWLHAERQRLRTLAVEAALLAANEAEDEGDHARAAERVAWAFRLEPNDEAVARRLIGLLERSGNRVAAVATYEALADRLRTELDLDPSPQTVELFAAIRDAADAAPDVRATPARGVSPQRVLVLRLENLTGDDRFDVLGGLAADTLARGLSLIPDLEVVPPLAVGPVPPDAMLPHDSATTSEPGGVPSSLAALARATGAGTLLDGSVHREGGALWFQVRVTDVAGGRLLPGPDPVRADESAPLEGIELLRERVVTAVAPALTQRVVHVREAARPPGVDAYRAYLDGLDQFVRGEWHAALHHFRKATNLSPDYALPRIVSAITLWNLCDLPQARAIALEADALRSSLGRFERAVLDMVLAWLDGDWAAAYRAAVVQAEMAPGSIPHFQVAEESRRLNHPREAREVLRRLNPEAGELRGWIFYWVELASAHHLLRDHARELEVASRCRRLHPHDPLAALLEARAFAGLGRTGDVVRVIDQILASPAGRKPPMGELIVEAGLELKAHGAADAGAALLERAVEWYRAEGGAHASSRRLLGRALYFADRLDEAHEILDGLARTSGSSVQPIGEHHAQLRAHLDYGFLAVIASRRDDAPELKRWCGRLEALDGPFLYGAQWFWLAAVAALRDDRERAIRLLRRAFADGLPMEMFVHTDPHLARLRGDERFDAIMRPRG
ncbi:MAG TPA: BTAD domain-containing putative transcriptional regulator [Longimicrobiales bacterium]